MSRTLLKTLRRAGRAVRAAWLVLGLALLLTTGLELSLRGVFALKDAAFKPTSPDPRVLRNGYGGKSWPLRHVRELKALTERWTPYVYFRQRPFHGETIAVDGRGRRAVWRPPDFDEGSIRLRVLMLGGSALWGYGARDDQTIPSLLARGLYERGVAAEVRNLSEIGYVGTQEVVALVRELQAGYRPDVVLFYDGVNDTTSALLAGEATLTTNEVNRAREFNLLQSPGRLSAALVRRLAADSAMRRLARSIARRLVGEPAGRRFRGASVDPAALARAVVGGCRANVGIVEALGREYGFRPLFVWQPSVFSKRRPTAFEREEGGKYAWAAPIFAEVGRALGGAADLRGRGDFMDLSGLFDDDAGLVFIDYCHTTEDGNRRIAEAVLPRLLECSR